VIHAQGSTEDFGSVEVVDGEDGGTLIEVHDEGEPSRAGGFFVSGEIDVGYFAVSSGWMSREVDEGRRREREGRKESVSS